MEECGVRGAPVAIAGGVVVGRTEQFSGEMAPVGEIILSCKDGDGRVAETMLDIYVTSGSMAVGTFDDSNLSYDSICRIAAAKAFER